jgi:K+-sensing histidine kinase KdpD
MKTSHAFLSIEQLSQYLISALVVGVTTGLMLLIGRSELGEAVIALLFLVPVGWSASRWGQGPGIFTALMAALAFDFFFIPPFNTFTVGSLEGWLVLAIFLAVAILVVGRIQFSLSKARTSEREAIMMYELSAALASLRTQEAVAYTVARFLRQKFLANLVTVFIQPKGQSTEIAAYEPQDGTLTGKPDRVIPLLNNWGLVGEVQIWGREIELPTTESRIFRNFASQIGQAIERTQLTEAGVFQNLALENAKVN